MSPPYPTDRTRRGRSRDRDERSNSASLSPDTEQQLDRRYLVPADLPWFADRSLPFPYAANNLYTSPLLASEELLLEDTPPATVVTTGFGPLGDQGYLYAKALQEAGVDVEIDHYPEMIHDFFNMEHLPDPCPRISTAQEGNRRPAKPSKKPFENAED